MIKRVEKEDLHTFTELANILWDEHPFEDLLDELSGIIGNANAQGFIKICDGKPVGFAQCQLRHDYVEGTNTSPVGYLEGILVLDEYQHRGYAKELLQECEKWAKEKGCKQFASDCSLTNDCSLHFHMAMGFEEANRIICFKKDL